MSKLLFGCVTDNKQKYLLQALYLVKSLREFGGEIAKSDFEVVYVDKIPVMYEKILTKYGVKFRQVPSYPSPIPATNKIQFFCHSASHLKAYEMVILLDCDTLVLKDPSRFLSACRGKIGLKAAQRNSVSPQMLLNLYNQFGIKDPGIRIKLGDPGMMESPIYCNSGVIVVSTEFLPKLGQRWDFYTRAIMKENKLNITRFLDQASLALVLAEFSKDLHLLPYEMNYQIHPQMDENFKSEAVILHYHTGFISCINHTNLPQINLQIDAFNKLIVNDLAKDLTKPS